MTENEEVTQRWTCMGTRVASGGKRGTRWLLPDDRQLTYTGKRDGLTGGIYDVPVEEKADGTYAGTPVWTGDRLPADDPELKLWRIEELAAEQALARQARERKAKAEGFSALDEAMDPLILMARSCRTGAQKSALIADVIRRLTYCWS